MHNLRGSPDTYSESANFVQATHRGRRSALPGGLDVSQSERTQTPYAESTENFFFFVGGGACVRVFQRSSHMYSGACSFVHDKVVGRREAQPAVLNVSE